MKTNYQRLILQDSSLKPWEIAELVQAGIASKDSFGNYSAILKDELRDEILELIDYKQPL